MVIISGVPIFRIFTVIKNNLIFQRHTDTLSEISFLSESRYLSSTEEQLFKGFTVTLDKIKHACYVLYFATQPLAKSERLCSSLCGKKGP